MAEGEVGRSSTTLVDCHGRGYRKHAGKRGFVGREDDTHTLASRRVCGVLVCRDCGPHVRRRT